MSGFVEKKDLENILLHIDDRIKAIKGMTDAIETMEFNYGVSDISVTLDGVWRDKTVASNAKLVLLTISWEDSTTGHLMWFYTRKKGSGQTWEGVARGRACADGGANVGSTILQPLDDDGKYQYKGGKDGGTFTLRQIGYFYK